jgi:hypothetical protein
MRDVIIFKKLKANELQRIASELTGNVTIMSLSLIEVEIPISSFICLG